MTCNACSACTLASSFFEFCCTSSSNFFRSRLSSIEFCATGGLTCFLAGPEDNAAEPFLTTVLYFGLCCLLLEGGATSLLLEGMLLVSTRPASAVFSVSDSSASSANSQCVFRASISQPSRPLTCIRLVRVFIKRIHQLSLIILDVHTLAALCKPLVEAISAPATFVPRMV